VTRAARRLDVTLAAGLPVYLLFHALSFRRVPSGLEGGPAVEALRGVRLIMKGKFEVMTFSIATSAETLWLYVVGASVILFGPDWFSVVLPSILASAAVVALTVILAARLAPDTPPAVPFLFSAGSVWLFHYGQVGLRAIAAPLFFLVVCLLIERAERPGAPARFHAATGFVLGLSIYAYSSCRVLPVAWLLWKGLQWAQEKDARTRLKSALLAGLAGLSVASIPNLLFFLREPGEFLFRGYYVYRGAWWWKPINVLWTALLPFHHPRFYTVWLGDGHNFDATAVSLTSAGVHPIDPVTALAFAAGLFVAMRMPRPPALSWILAVLGVGTIFLGVSGPSLTRLLVLQPAYALLATLGAGGLRSRFPRAALWAAPLLLVPFLLGAAEYAAFGRSDEAQIEYLPAANAAGARARDLTDADPGKRVLIVLRKGRDVVKLYTYRSIERIWLMELVSGNVDTTGHVLARFRPGVVLVERRPEIALFAVSLGRERARAFPLFDEYEMPPAPGGDPPDRGNIRRLWNEIER
jgi:hypothetical protein